MSEAEVVVVKERGERELRRLRWLMWLAVGVAVASGIVVHPAIGMGVLAGLAVSAQRTVEESSRNFWEMARCSEFFHRAACEREKRCLLHARFILEHGPRFDLEDVEQLEGLTEALWDVNRWEE